MAVHTRQGKYLYPFINENNIKIIAEIGVWKGHTARYLLRHCPNIEEYWGVDPWMQLGDGFGKMSNLTQDNWDNLYKRMCLDMRWFKAFKALRLISKEAVELFYNNYFDLVFIDGNHYYEAVKEDTTIWLPKVKRGGYISGHDYGSRKHFGVKKAVDEIFGEKNITSHRSSMVWLIQKQ